MNAGSAHALQLRTLARLTILNLFFVAFLGLVHVQPVSGSEEHFELLLRDSKDSLILAIPLPERSFAIRYTHSVALTPVTDFFRVEPSSIILDRTEYQDFGAGLPHSPEPGQVMSTSDGRITISGYNRKMENFDLRVGRVAGHVLLVPDGDHVQEIPLNSLIKPGNAIRFSVRSPVCTGKPFPKDSPAN